MTFPSLAGKRLSLLHGFVKIFAPILIINVRVSVQVADSFQTKVLIPILFVKLLQRETVRDALG